MKCPSGICSGHYVTDLTLLLDIWKLGNMIPAKPPNEILQSFLGVRQNIEEITDRDIRSLGKECNLTIEEIKLSLEHLRQVESTEKEVLKRQRRPEGKRQYKKGSRPNIKDHILSSGAVSQLTSLCDFFILKHL